jgi:hypothetical protein
VCGGGRGLCLSVEPIRQDKMKRDNIRQRQDKKVTVNSTPNQPQPARSLSVQKSTVRRGGGETKTTFWTWSVYIRFRFSVSIRIRVGVGLKRKCSLFGLLCP